MTYRVLAVYAHPDDESFGVGGTLAKLAAQGHDVTLACATRGEAGEISDPALATPENLGQVREGELRASCKALGINPPRFLGYRDSGMVDTPDNDDPRSYHQADPETATKQLVVLIRELKPHVVFTFEPFGGYGHPDHIAVSKHVTAAFDAAGDAQAYPDAGAPWQPQRLYYGAIPRSFFVEMRDRLKAAGIDTKEMEERLLRQDRWFDDKDITHEHDVSMAIDAKWASLNAHQTQFGPSNFFFRLPHELLRQGMQREFFQQARPQLTMPEAAARLTDLFDGVKVGD